VNPDLVVRDGEGKVMTVRYEAVDCFFASMRIRDGKRFIVKDDYLLTAFLSLEKDAIAPKGANENATRQNVA
jgi:hypothetical protein